ncbi:MAG: hypothetical protein HKN72_10990 [Gemmatimonadetes bacterium]|nr:hypothetical protein [Gemmatimonadota bacterium]NNF13743.1 hypothetical protein [Gemmatimonadota bacterium]
MFSFTIAVLVVSATSVIQSLFGVGVLLFGTPWLLLIGLDFIPALQFLLPVSVSISVLQLVGDAEHVEKGMISKLGLLALPAIAITLWMASTYRPPLDLVVAAIVAWVALKDRVGWIGRSLEALLRYERTYIAFMGAVHGASNLGGGLLTAWVYGKGLHGRAARGTVAACYLLFALVQLATLAVGPASWQPTLAQNALLTLVAATVFLLTDRLLFARVNAAQFRKGLEVLLLATSVLLVARSVL